VVDASGLFAPHLHPAIGAAHDPARPCGLAVSQSGLGQHQRRLPLCGKVRTPCAAAGELGAVRAEAAGGLAGIAGAPQFLQEGLVL